MRKNPPIEPGTPNPYTPPDTGSEHVGFRCVMTPAMQETTQSKGGNQAESK